MVAVDAESIGCVGCGSASKEKSPRHIGLRWPMVPTLRHAVLPGMSNHGHLA